MARKFIDAIAVPAFLLEWRRIDLYLFFLDGWMLCLLSSSLIPKLLTNKCSATLCSGYFVTRVRVFRTSAGASERKEGAPVAT